MRRHRVARNELTAQLIAAAAVLMGAGVFLATSSRPKQVVVHVGQARAPQAAKAAPRSAPPRVVRPTQRPRQEEPASSWTELSRPVPPRLRHDDPQAAGPEVVLPRVERPRGALRSRARPRPSSPARPVVSNPALAILRAGSVSCGDEQLDAGDPLPAGRPLRVGAGPVLVESPGAVRVRLAPRSRFTVRQGPKGRLLYGLTRGTVLAASLGKRPYAVTTRDGLAVPLGTTFLVSTSPWSIRTRVATLEGTVRVCTQETSGDRASKVDVRAGFEVRLSGGRLVGPTRPLRGWPGGLRWIRPRSERPRLPTPPTILRSVTSSTIGFKGFTTGTRHFGRAYGSGFSVRGEADSGSYTQRVELKNVKVFEFDPDLWIEVVCRVDRETELLLQASDPSRKEKLEKKLRLPGDRWSTVTVPLRAFRRPKGKPLRGTLRRKRPCNRFTIYAGPRKDRRQVELLVDMVRFVRQK